MFSLTNSLVENTNIKDWLSGDTTTLIIAFLLITTVTWYFYLFFFKYKAQNLPPGPPGLPIFGNLLSLDPELHTYFTGLAQTHGPIFKFWLGSKLGIVISSPSLAREVLKDHDTIFANRDVPAAGRAVTYGGIDIVWSPYGPEWRMLRKVCVLKLVSKTSIDSVYKLRRSECRKAVRYIHNWVGSPVNIGDEVSLIVLNMITNMIWGAAVEGEERESLGAEFRETVEGMVHLLGKPNLSDFFPRLARFDLQGVVKDMDALVPRFDTIFEKMISERAKKKVEGKENGSADFLQFLLNLKEEGNSKTPITNTHVKALLMDIVVGGSDSSSSTIEFAMAELMNNPEIMKKVQEELEAVVGKDNLVEDSHIHQLPYLHAVVKETLRLHAVIPLLVPHSPSETTNVGGYTIPKGSRVFLNVWAIHRDPSIWERPLEFDPTRFLDSKCDYNGNDFNYFPFGSGRRICVGIALAERTVLYILATLVHLFDWNIPQGEKLEVSEKFGIVLKKKTPLLAIPTPRISNPELYK